MNIEKLTIAQFNELKQSQRNLFEDFDKIYNQKKDDPNFNSTDFEKHFFYQLIELQNKLLSYDLSEIPFEAWNDILILADKWEDITVYADFSKTKANIDFKILEASGNLIDTNFTNFKNCNIKNIESITYLSDNAFDSDVIKKNFHLFLSSNFSKEFKKKFCYRELTMEDISFLSPSQLSELQTKRNWKSHFSFVSFNNMLLKSINLEKLIELYKFSQIDFEILNYTFGNFVYLDDIATQQFVEKISISELQNMKSICYDYLKSLFFEYGMRFSQFPQKFLEENDDIFLTHSNISNEVKDRYYNQRLTLEDIENNFELFKNIPIENFIGDFLLKSFAQSFGSGNFQIILNKHKDVIHHIIDFDRTWIFKKIFSKVQSFEGAVKLYCLNYHFNEICLGEFPEWLQSMNFKVVKEYEYQTFEEMKQYNEQTLLLNLKQVEILETLGINNMIRCNESTNLFSKIMNIDYFENQLVNYLNKISSIKEKMNTYEEFENLIADFLGNSTFDHSQIVGEFRVRHPSIFLDDNAPLELKRKFYEKRLGIEDYSFLLDNIHYFSHTNISYGFDDVLSWTRDLFQNKDCITSNLYKLKVSTVFLKIKEEKIQKVFQEYIEESSENFDINKIDELYNLIFRLETTNSVEMYTCGKGIILQLLSCDNPIEKFTQIEDVFLRNNLPFVGKVFSVFDILYPNFEEIASLSRISPVLKRKSMKARKAIIFSDLLRASLGSNNRSLIDYLDNLEKGNQLFIDLYHHKITLNELKSEDKDILKDFSNHLITLYNNTFIKRNPSQSNHTLINLSDSLEENLKVLFLQDEKVVLNLPDKIVKMFGHYAGFDSLTQMKNYIIDHKKNADSKNRKLAKTKITLDKGDFVKGINSKDYLSTILQNGSVAKEFLGVFDKGDCTPLDTDLSKIEVLDKDIQSTISHTISNSYGDIFFVLKNDGRFLITRENTSDTYDEKIYKVSNHDISGKKYNNEDLHKLEAFCTASNDHYGIRTGFASSEIDYIVCRGDYDKSIGLDIAMNGFYIPVVDGNGKVIFTEEEYDKLRSQMMGLKYYEEKKYQLASLDTLSTPEILNIADSLVNNAEEVTQKRIAIQNTVIKALQEIGIHNVKYEISKDLTPGIVEFIDTGSTGRYTNVPGDGDFDFIMKLDKDFMIDDSKLRNLREILRKTFPSKEFIITSRGDIRAKNVKIDGLDTFVDIDISFVQKTDKITYSTDMCLRERLNSIHEQYPNEYPIVLANILMAKKVLKDANVYKSKNNSTPQGGLGGVGVENWILQNGGSLEIAARSFLKVANEVQNFEEFKKKYAIWDFGENHFSRKDSNFSKYSHDNFVTDNMDPDGYDRMKQALRNYIENLDYGLSHTSIR